MDSRPSFRNVTIPLLVLMFSLLLVPTNVRAPEQLSLSDTDPPVHIHLTWNSADTSHTIVVTWQTNTSTAGDQVLYDTISREGKTSDYRFEASGSHHTYPRASGYIHDVELAGLSPDTTYYFVCGGEAGGYSAERGFRTGPSEQGDLRFAAGGDSRMNIEPRDKISRAMALFNPSFAIHTGDFVDDGADQRMWDDWFPAMERLWIGSNGLTIPILPCLGNHEGNATNYYGQFALPGNEQWFSIDWGPDVHIIALNSEADPAGRQLEWLESDLQSHRFSKWKIVFFHRPIASSSTHGPTLSLVQHWVPLFDKYHVDLAISGHDHNYERSYPVNATACGFMPQPSAATGTIYIVSAGWGAGLYQNGSSWWTAFSAKKYHFVLVDIYTNGSLHLQAKDDQGSTFDEAWIHKDEPRTTATLLVGEVSVVTESTTVTVTETSLTTVGATPQAALWSMEIVLLSSVAIALTVVTVLLLKRRRSSSSHR